MEPQDSSTPNASSLTKRLALSQLELGASNLLGTAEEVQRTRVSSQGQPAKNAASSSKGRGGLGCVREQRSPAERTGRAK